MPKLFRKKKRCKKKGNVLAGAGSSASSVFTAMAGGTGTSAQPSKKEGIVPGVKSNDDAKGGGGGGGGGGVTVGWEGVAHPLLVDDVDEDAQAEQLLLLHSAHLLLLPPLLSSISCPRPVVEEETVSVAAEFFGSFE